MQGVVERASSSATLSQLTHSERPGPAKAVRAFARLPDRFAHTVVPGGCRLLVPLTFLRCLNLDYFGIGGRPPDTSTVTILVHSRLSVPHSRSRGLRCFPHSQMQFVNIR